MPDATPWVDENGKPADPADGSFGTFYTVPNKDGTFPFLRRGPASEVNGAAKPDKVPDAVKAFFKPKATA